MTRRLFRDPHNVGVSHFPSIELYRPATSVFITRVMAKMWVLAYLSAILLISSPCTAFVTPLRARPTTNTRVAHTQRSGFAPATCGSSSRCSSCSQQCRDSKYESVGGAVRYTPVLMLHPTSPHTTLGTRIFAAVYLWRGNQHQCMTCCVFPPRFSAKTVRS